MLDLITEAEKQMIKDWIKDNAGSDELKDYRRDMAPLETILKPWSLAKSEYLLKGMGGSLIVKKTIEYEKDNEELRSIMHSFSEDSPICKFREAYNTITFEEFYRKGKDEYYELHRLMDSYCLIDNKYPCSQSLIVPNPKNEKTPLKLEPNGKIIKFLGKFAKAYDIPGFEGFAIEHSKVLNQKRLTGELTLSIHPLDYMTMSDNACCWSSCMSWTEQGCYRQGTVEMMNSPMVIVAYLASSSSSLYINQTGRWNSKKWRELFIVTPNIITGVKGYPYDNAVLEDCALTEIKKLFEKNLGWKYGEKIEKYSDRDTTLDSTGRAYCVKTYTNYMYNDFGNKDQKSRCYLSSSLDDDTIIELYYSGMNECIYCGEETKFDTEKLLICDECGEYEYCTCCNNLICFNDDSDNIQYYNGNPYCSDCFDDLASCTYCGEVVEDEPFKAKVIVSSGCGYWGYNHTVYLCKDHWKQFVRKRSQFINNKDVAKDIKSMVIIEGSIEFNIVIDDLTIQGKRFLNY